MRIRTAGGRPVARTRAHVVLSAAKDRAFSRPGQVAASAQPAQNLRHPLAVFGLHAAGAQADEIVAIPIGHRSGVLAETARERGERQVEIVLGGAVENRPRPLARRRGARRAHRPDHDVELRGKHRRETIVGAERGVERQGSLPTRLEPAGELARRNEWQRALRRPQRHRGGAGA